MNKIILLIVIILATLVYFYIYPERCEKLLGDENTICEMGW